MLGAIYTSQSGMAAFETGLTIIGNNVSNLNTPGYKATEPIFSDVEVQTQTGAMIGSEGSPTDGAGVTVKDSDASFAQGQFQQTGNPLDAGVNGQGFFIVQQNGSYVYTRDGQFQIDSSGDLLVGQPSILLQQVKDDEIGSIQLAVVGHFSKNIRWIFKHRRTLFFYYGQRSNLHRQMQRHGLQIREPSGGIDPAKGDL